MWIRGYIYGQYTDIKDFEAGLLDESGDPVAIITKANAIFPLIETGVNEEGGKIYQRDETRTDCIVLAATYGESGQAVIDALISDGRFTVHLETTKEEIADLYPEFCIGQCIPYIC